MFLFRMYPAGNEGNRFDFYQIRVSKPKHTCIVTVGFFNFFLNANGKMFFSLSYHRFVAERMNRKTSTGIFIDEYVLYGTSTVLSTVLVCNTSRKKEKLYTIYIRTNILYCTLQYHYFIYSYVLYDHHGFFTVFVIICLCKIINFFLLKETNIQWKVVYYDCYLHN